MVQLKEGLGSGFNEQNKQYFYYNRGIHLACKQDWGSEVGVSVVHTVGIFAYIIVVYGVSDQIYHDTSFCPALKTYFDTEGILHTILQIFGIQSGAHVW